MTGEAAYDLMCKAVRSIKGLGNLDPIDVLDPDRPVGNGSTMDFMYYATYSVGVKEFMDEPEKEFPDEMVAQAMIALFHEVCGHGGQITVEFDEADNDLSKVLALNHYACMGSPRYYGSFDTTAGTVVTSHYFRQPQEIAAQYAGIRSADVFLSIAWDPARANTAICAAHGSRLVKTDKFPGGMAYVSNGEPRDKVDEILSDLDGEFAARVFEHRPYVPGCDPFDIVSRADRQFGNGRYGKAIQRCRNGVKEDWMVTALVAKMDDPNGVIRSKEALIGLAMDTAKAFSMASVPIGTLFHPRRADIGLDGLDEHVDRSAAMKLLGKESLEAAIEETTPNGVGIL